MRKSKGRSKLIETLLKINDLIIFDTSRNSHSGYYKVKSLNNNIIHINKSNLDKIKESL